LTHPSDNCILTVLSGHWSDRLIPHSHRANRK